MGDCADCDELRMRIRDLEASLKEANDRAAKATDLMVKGEALRGKIMLGAILGTFPPKKPEAVA